LIISGRALCRIDFDRTDVRSTLTFGNGIHACIGLALARLQGRAAFEVLARRLPDLRLATKDEVTFKPSFILRVPVELQVTWS
jgi:cytochrome P450